jgi:hypothetical protein
MKHEPSSELLEYASAYVDQRLDAQQLAALEEILRNDAGARRIFAQFLHDHAALQWHYIDTGTTSQDVLGWLEQDGEAQRSQKQGMSRMAWVAMAACLLIGLVVSWFVSPGWHEDSAEHQAQVKAEVQAEAMSQGVAKTKAETKAEAIAEIKSTAAYLIRKEGNILLNGAPLGAADTSLKPGDTLVLEQGLLELVFRETDVHVIAVPPLKMTVVSNAALKLDSGELKLHVPPQGVGFEVETQERKIIDLGTSFVISTYSQQSQVLSQVLVLDGKILVEDTPGGEQLALEKGEVASFTKGSRLEVKHRMLEGLPDFSAPMPQAVTKDSLRGRFFSFGRDTKLSARTFPLVDHLGAQFIPLVEGGFNDEVVLAGLQEGHTLAFNGIAGAHGKLADYARSDDASHYKSWVMWYQGKVKAPKPGRYRFWGYADNYLLVAINGKPVFNGSRFDTALREELAVKSERHPAFPCFNAKAGIASGEWIELGDEPVRIDILFGEMGNRYTSGILQIEREGDQYPHSYWGQPQWPLFLTQKPSEHRAADFKRLNNYLENSLRGSFSIPENAIWQVIE